MKKMLSPSLVAIATAGLTTFAHADDVYVWCESTQSSYLYGQGYCPPSRAVGSGNASVKPKQNPNPEAEKNPLQIAFQACYSELKESNSAVTLRSKLPIDVNQASDLEVLSANQKITKSEKALLLDLTNRWGKCIEIGNEYRMTIMPTDMVSVYSQYWLATKSLLADLYAGQVTFADVSKKRIAMEQEYTGRLQLLVNNYKAQAAKEEAYQRRLAEQKEAYQQQLAIEQQRSEYLKKLQKEQARQADINNGLMLLQMARPQPAAPNLFGNGINCRSQAIGNAVNTNCW